MKKERLSANFGHGKTTSTPWMSLSMTCFAKGDEIETWVMPWPPMLRHIVCVFVMHTSHAYDVYVLRVYVIQGNDGAVLMRYNNM